MFRRKRAMVMIESEKQLIRKFQTEPTKEICLLCNTKEEAELRSIIQSKNFWNEWIDTSAHNAPPPDFYSDKYGLMIIDGGRSFLPRSKMKHSKIKPCTSVRIRYNNPNKIRIVPWRLLNWMLPGHFCC